MQDNLRIVVVGFMYSGKTTFGKRLANRLGYRFVDLDKEIENSVHFTINDIFERFGEKVFRDIEAKVLRENLKGENFVLSTGGGTACFAHNMQIINDNSVSIYLKMSAVQIYSRFLKSKKQRALLMGKNPLEAKSIIENLLPEREKYYNLAKITIDGFNPDTDKTISLLNNFLQN